MRVNCKESGKLATSSSMRNEVNVRLYQIGTPELAGTGARIFSDFGKWDLKTEPRSWDLLSIALAVTAADTFVLRKCSSDGWTRDIELIVEVSDFRFWDSVRPIVEKILSFLSGDRWRLEFLKGKFNYPIGTQLLKASTVSLFSGGLDSFAGAITCLQTAQQPLLISQSYPIDHSKQNFLAEKLGLEENHIQLNHNIRGGAYQRDASMRTRSFLFFAYGVLAASTLKAYYRNKRVDLIVPENGFISINVPLTNLRIGSLSTRTTHPDFMSMYQELLEHAGLNVRLTNPFQFLTKGELVHSLRTNRLFKQYAEETNSCGRAHRIHMHCGRCVPCIIRRASFKAGKLADSTEYKYAALASQRNYDDIMSFAYAIQTARQRGIERWAIGSLPATASANERANYLRVIELGLAEAESFLKGESVL